MSTDAKRRLIELGEAPHPRYVVWELTLKCDLACRHCGSRAGKARSEELTVDEARSVVADLAALGTQEIAFIGGEAYLHPDWLDIVRATADAGIRPSMTTGARRLTADLCRRAADAGLQAASVSVDGLEHTHDTLRAVPGSFRAAVSALEHIAAAGMQPYANTQLNRLNVHEIDELLDILVDAGAQAWQVQLTGPMGRAADRPEWLLQPFELLSVLDRVAAAVRRVQASHPDFAVHAGNNLGYFGPHEGTIRQAPYPGCTAGRYLLGIESNGDVKGCPSMPSAPYVGGNVRDTPLPELWANNARIAYARRDRTPDLWGFCKSCYYAKHCQGGCTWTSHTLLGRPGNMPYCYHRAESLKARGRRERIVRAESAPGKPFDFGRFTLIEEDWPSTDG